MQQYTVYRLTAGEDDFVWFGPAGEPLSACLLLANAYAAGKIHSAVAEWFWAKSPMLNAESAGLSLRAARAAARGGTLNGPGRRKGFDAPVVCVDRDLTCHWFPTTVAAARAAGCRTGSAVRERLGRIDPDGRLYLLCHDWGIKWQKE